jgi:hypothetical protein
MMDCKGAVPSRPPKYTSLILEHQQRCFLSISAVAYLTGLSVADREQIVEDMEQSPDSLIKANSRNIPARA